VSIFIQKEGPKAENLSYSSPQCLRQTAKFLQQWPALTFGQWGPPGLLMPGSTHAISQGWKMASKTRF